jgi:hypothetical protein
MIRISVFSFVFLCAGFVCLGSASCYSQTVLGNIWRANQSIAGFLAVPRQSSWGAGSPMIARGAQREIIQNIPIELRPSRPFHFYGNTVRRNYYGQSMLPFANRR